MPFTRFLLGASFLASALLGVRADVDISAVGPSTSLSEKTTICDITDYGAVADGETDISSAISSAFSECASAGGATLRVPAGNYSLSSGVTLKGGSAWAFQLDGLITLTSDGDFSGNAIVIEDSSDVEFYSSNGLGAINGQGYITRRDDTDQNARLLRFISVDHLSVHDIILVDSPTFHLIFNECSNLEMYHITVRGPDIGGTDGIDLICSDNCYLHHFEVTNRDECVSVKSPSKNVLIEEGYCNHSGGMSIGSLTADIDDSSDAAAVENIVMSNIYAFESTQILMIKTFPGGDGATGYVKNSVFENFWSYDCTYGLDIDQYWESTTSPDTGAVELTGLTFTNWTGHVDNGVSRGDIVIRGSDIVPLTNITIEDFSMWTLNNDEVINQCKNVYGTGYCIQSLADGATATTYTTSVTSTEAPSDYTSPTSPAWGISGYGTTDPIPVYTPAAFWTVASSSSAYATSTSAASAAETSVAYSSAAVAASTPSTPASYATSVASASYASIASSASSAAAFEETSDASTVTTDSSDDFQSAAFAYTFAASASGVATSASSAAAYSSAASVASFSSVASVSSVVSAASAAATSSKGSRCKPTYSLSTAASASASASASVSDSSYSSAVIASSVAAGSSAAFYEASTLAVSSAASAATKSRCQSTITITTSTTLTSALSYAATYNNNAALGSSVTSAQAGSYSAAANSAPAGFASGMGAGQGAGAGNVPSFGFSAAASSTTTSRCQSTITISTSAAIESAVSTPVSAASSAAYSAYSAASSAVSSASPVYSAYYSSVASASSSRASRSIGPVSTKNRSSASGCRATKTASGTASATSAYRRRN